MAQLAIIGTYEIVPGRMDEFLPLLLAHRNRCLEDEPGTIRFDVLRRQNVEDQVMLYEVYTDDAAFQVHWNGPHVARMRAEATSMITKLTGIRCTLLA